MPKPWKLDELQELASRMSTLNPQLAAILREEELKVAPWTADPNWREKDQQLCDDIEARIAVTRARLNKGLREWEERYGRPYA